MYIPVLTVLAALLVPPDARLFAAESGGKEYTLQTERLHAPAGDVILAVPSGESATKLLMQVSVPACTVEELSIGGERFHRVRLGGYGTTSEAGMPQLPVKGYLIAVPGGAVLAAKVLRSESVVHRGCRVLPVPECGAVETGEGAYSTFERFVTNPAAYGSRSPYPGEIVAVGSYGYLRDVRVAELLVFPVQYTPGTEELVCHGRIWIELSLAGSVFPIPTEWERGAGNKSHPFEGIYRDLIVNYAPECAAVAGRGAAGAVFRRYPSYLQNNPYKIPVDEDGLYVIDYTDLVGAGISPAGVDPKTIKIFNGGKEVSIFVSGEEDGRFDASDFIEFFGLGNTGYFSLSNVYWLSWGGARGLRMAQRDCSPGDSLPVPDAFTERLHFEENALYYSEVWEGEGKDHWFWQQMNAPGTYDFDFTLVSVADTSADALMTISLRGKTYLTHQHSISVNGAEVATFGWDGAGELEEDIRFPQSSLISGSNRLRIDCLVSGCRAYLNWFTVAYARLCTAAEGSLRFCDPADGPNQFEIGGFTSDRIEAFRVTDPRQPERLVNASVEGDAAAYRLVFEDSLDSHEYYIVGEGHRKKPKAIIADEPSDLLDPAAGADYIIVTHGDFYVGACRIAELREEEGLRVKVVKIDDVYDEFSYGNSHPQAVRDLAEYAFYNWPQPSPSYLLLVGDASFDYRGVVTGGNRSYVPTRLFISQTYYLEAATDDWFVSFIGDDRYPDMLVGRISAQSSATLSSQIDKIVDYERSIPAGQWREDFLLIADLPDEGGDYEYSVNRFGGIVESAGFDPLKLFVRNCTHLCRQSIIDSIDAGCIVTSFVGHGSIDSWSKQHIFQSTDVGGLNNGSLQPLVVTFNCLNGFFHHALDDYCLAEAFVRAPGKGAVACWSHSGLDYNQPSESIGCALFERLLLDGDYILGSAICKTKITYLATKPFFWDQAVMLILFGDPALEVGLPGRPDLLPGRLSFDPAYPQEGSSDTLTALVFNAGRADAPETVVRFSFDCPGGGDPELIEDIMVPAIAAGDRKAVAAVWDSLPAAGTYRIHVEIDPLDQLLESCEWNNVLSDTIHVYRPGEVQDTVAPTVDFFVDGKRIGVELPDGSYTSSCPLIEAFIRDSGAGIDTESVKVRLDGNLVDDFELEHDGMGSAAATLRYEPGPVRDGDHTVEVSVSDCSIRRNCAGVTVRFVVESRLVVRNATTFPNPSRGSTVFSYILSQQADDVTIEIYAVNGALVKVIPSAPAMQNGNTAAWDGRDGAGREISAGVYFYRVRASRKGSRDECNGKLVFIR